MTQEERNFSVYSIQKLYEINGIGLIDILGKHLEWESKKEETLGNHLTAANLLYAAKSLQSHYANAQVNNLLAQLINADC